MVNLRANRYDFDSRVFSRRVKAKKVKQRHARVSIAVRVRFFHRVRQAAANFVAIFYLCGGLCRF